MDSRKRMGKDKDGVIFPVAPNLSEMSDSYLDFIEEVKKEIQKQRISVVLNANSSMICLYWNIGRAIEYYVAAEPPVRCGVSHLSGLTEPLI